MKKILCIIFGAFLLNSCNTTKKPEPVPVESVPEKEVAEENPVDDEFLRSTLNVDISREQFEQDKNEILETIAKLSEIMTDYDFESWLKYIEKDSVAYWSDPVNLKNASKRLPSQFKKHGLNSLTDYFRLVFIPSRRGRSVQEIRYLSHDSVKAVEVREDTDVVYYNFIKSNGKWLVKIPPLQG